MQDIHMTELSIKSVAYRNVNILHWHFWKKKWKYIVVIYRDKDYELLHKATNGCFIRMYVPVTINQINYLFRMDKIKDFKVLYKRLFEKKIV